MHKYQPYLFDECYFIHLIKMHKYAFELLYKYIQFITYSALFNGKVHLLRKNYYKARLDHPVGGPSALKSIGNLNIILHA